MSATGRRVARRHLRRLRLRDVLVFLALPIFLLVHLVTAATLEFSEARKFQDWWSKNTSISRFMASRAFRALLFPRTQMIRGRLDPEAADAGILRLSVAPSAWHAWQRDPMARDWIEADLIRGNRLERVKIRKRGDTSVHWLTEKKSFTLKTQRDQLFKGHRRLGFSLKDVLPQFVTGRLASEFALLAPFTAVSPVFVNKRFYGIFRAIEPIDESFLRRVGRLPGNVFRGDAAERGEVYKGVRRGLFANPSIWERVATPSGSDLGPAPSLSRFLDDLNGGDFEAHLQFMSWLDRDEIAELLALMLFVGDPFHMDGVHNQFFYEDPSSGKFHPIPWDLRLLPLEDATRRKGTHLNAFLREALRNPFIYAEALARLRPRLDALVERGEELAAMTETRYEDAFLFDRLRRTSIADVGSSDTISSVLRGNAALLRTWFDDARIGFYRPEHGPSAGKNPFGDDVLLLDFEMRGNAGVAWHSIELRSQPQGPLRIVADQNRNGALDAEDREVATHIEPSGEATRLALETPEVLLPGFDAHGPTLEPAPLHYRFFLVGSVENVQGPVIGQVDLRNVLTGAVVTPEDWPVGESALPTTSWHPWQYPSDPEPRMLRFAGTVHLRETLIVERGDTLVVDPGTVLHLDPDVSILVHGKTFWRGSAEHPIIVDRSDPERPWGSVALQGSGSDGSEFRHTVFIGGGGATLSRVTYKGMVSVHRARDVLFRHCHFDDSARSDDAFNAVHAHVILEDSLFSNAVSDAVDFDYSSGSIARNRFIRPGNDAIDLMHSSPVIASNEIIGASDKGVSIGERSHPLLYDNRIAECERGIEVKDGSEPILALGSIHGNRVGVQQSVKNWRYGDGGWIKFLNASLYDNDLDWKSGPRTRETRGTLDFDPRIAFATPIVEAHFADDFESLTDGWTAGGGVTRLVKRRGDLVLSLQRDSGTAWQALDWRLKPGSRYVALFEIGGRDLRSAEISLISESRETTTKLELSAEPGRYSLVPIELEAGNYTELRISAEPDSNSARLRLHGYSVYALPKEGES